MSSPTPKQVLFGHFAAVARTIGNAHRIDLLQQLAQGEQSVETLARKTGLTVANASQHLQHLRRAGLVTARRNGTFIYYRLADDAVLDVIAALRRLAERNLAEVEKVVPVTREELAKRLKSGDVTVLDVRPEDEFALAHVPGAINVPLKELEKRTAEIDSTKDIVAYCRGAYCVYSYEAVAKLRAKGFSIRRLEDGLPEWKAAGLPVESASKES
jgi:rhodanese-related sulfurtransferase/DNA-binding transcriptional ArsR family regulator